MGGCWEHKSDSEPTQDPTQGFVHKGNPRGAGRWVSEPQAVRLHPDRRQRNLQRHAVTHLADDEQGLTQRGRQLHALSAHGCPPWGEKPAGCDLARSLTHSTPIPALCRHLRPWSMKHVPADSRSSVEHECARRLGALRPSAGCVAVCGGTHNKETQETHLSLSQVSLLTNLCATVTV